MYDEYEKEYLVIFYENFRIKYKFFFKEFRGVGN